MVLARRPMIMLLSGLALLASCATQQQAWSRSGSGALIEPEPAASLGYATFWVRNLNIPSSQRIGAARLLDDLIVVVEQPSNVVYAVSVRDGSIRWRKVVGDPGEPLYSPVRAGDQLLVNSATHLYILNAHTGELERIDSLAHVVSSGPVHIGSFVIFGDVKGRVFAHDIRAGFTKWSYQLTSNIAVPPVDAGQNQALVADARGVYALLGAEDGQLIWRGRTFGPVTTRSAIDRLGVYIASQDQTLYALARPTGLDRWKFPTTYRQIGPPVVMGVSVYLPLGDEALVAINSADGAERWRLPFGATPVTFREEENRLLVRTPQSLKLVDAQTGQVVADAPTQRLATVLTGPEGSLVLIAPNGRLMRLNPKR